MDLFRIQHFYFTVIINVLCCNKVWLREAIISDIATINWVPTSPGCYLKEKLQVGFTRSWGLTAWAQGQGSSAGTRRGSQSHCREAMATARPGLGETLVSWGSLARPLPELWPPLCPATAWLLPLIQVQTTPEGQRACQQALCDLGKTRNRRWFACRKIKLFVSSACKLLLRNREKFWWIAWVRKQKVHPQPSFPKQHWGPLLLFLYLHRCSLECIWLIEFMVVLEEGQRDVLAVRLNVISLEALTGKNNSFPSIVPES